MVRPLGDKSIFCELAECFPVNNSKGYFYEESHFRLMLRLERKRTERTKIPFMLMVADLSALKGNNYTDLVNQLIFTLASYLRETDILGWYRQKESLGVIFTGMINSKSTHIEKMLQKLHAAFKNKDCSPILEEIKISFYQYPEDDDDGVENIFMENDLYSTAKPKLLIVDDDEDLRNQMKWAFIRDYDVLLAGDRGKAMELFLKNHPSVVILDLGLQPNPASVEEGFATLSDILNIDNLTKVIIVTGHAEKQNALRAVKQGAYDIFFKPIIVDNLGVVIKRALYESNLERDRMNSLRYTDDNAFEGIIGNCSKMQNIYSVIKKSSNTDVPILITGGSGTGKELVARAIHRLSYRASGNLVVINCAAIPENLLESELFGHEKGSFTGAHSQRKGRIEYAHQGTLLLDEIGDLPLSLQAKLLRFLQDQKVERIGSREPIFVDVRTLASTNRNLKSAVQAGTFREDLYFRLGVIEINLPPLREREGDIILLAKLFLNRFAKENNKRISGFSSQAIIAMKHHDWTGNVRELEHRVERAAIMAEGSKIGPGDLELTYSTPDAGISLKEAKETLEREMILKAISRNDGSMTKTALELGISRPSLYNLMEKIRRNGNNK